MFVKHTLTVLMLMLVFSVSMSCYNVYNITLEGNFSEGEYLRIRKIDGLKNFDTNCVVEEEYLYCNNSFWFQGVNDFYSKPFVFEERYLQQNFSKDMEEYLSFSSGEWVNVSREIVSTSEHYLDTVMGIVLWVYENVQYTDNFRYLSSTFRDRRGNCESISELSVNMLRSVNIPSKVAYGWKGGEAHAWIEVYYPFGEWISIDPTLGSYGYLGRDYVLLGYSKMSYMESNKNTKVEGYNFQKIGEENCVVKLRKRGDFIYNPHKNILTYHIDDFGSWPYIIPPNYSNYNEIEGVDVKESLYDKILGVFLNFKSFLNKEI